MTNTIFRIEYRKALLTPYMTTKRRFYSAIWLKIFITLAYLYWLTDKIDDGRTCFEKQNPYDRYRDLLWKEPNSFHVNAQFDRNW